jgi:galactofuranose transport system substrate-binding protein
MRNSNKPNAISFLVIAGILIWGPLPVDARIKGKIVLGFSQIGAESAWRVANSKSIKEAAVEAGIHLVFEDAQQKQANQIKAIKSFILQKVDVIAFSPVTQDGWHDVLIQAKNAGIPVILLDRAIEEKDDSLYTTIIGSDFRFEGRKIGECLVDLLKKENRSGAALNLVELQGTIGSAPAIQRNLGFFEIIGKYKNIKTFRSESGDFKETNAKQLMEKILQEASAQKTNIDIVFAHNDNMALGAISAIESMGLKPGKDILLVSVDGIREAFVAMDQGKLNCTMECNPLLGPQLMKAVLDVANGKKIPKRVVTPENLYQADTAKAELPKRKY